MPGFIDTHHHQFETALRSFLADGVLINDGSGSPSGSTTYFEFILLKFAPVYRPQDVYINELFGGPLASSTTASRRCTTSRRSITRRQHSDAAIKALIDTGRRVAFGYFESAGASLSAPIPATNIRKTRSASRISGSPIDSDQRLVHMIMGGEVYLGDPTTTSPGRSGGSSSSRLRRTSSHHSASPRFWTCSPTVSRRQRHTSGLDRTTCSST